MFLLINAATKIFIWQASSKEVNETKAITYPVIMFKSTARETLKYTTRFRQKTFYAIDRLLTPAFLMAFIMLAVRLINTPGIFKENA